MTFEKLAFSQHVLRELETAVEKRAMLGAALGLLSAGAAGLGGIDQAKKYYQGFKPQQPRPPSVGDVR